MKAAEFSKMETTTTVYEKVGQPRVFSKKNQKIKGFREIDFWFAFYACKIS